MEMIINSGCQLNCRAGSLDHEKPPRNNDNQIAVNTTHSTPVGKKIID